MHATRDARSATAPIVAIAAVSVALVLAAPALAGPDLNAHWWIVLGSLLGATLVLQAAAMVLARGRHVGAALMLALVVGWAVISTTTQLMWVNDTFLLLGIAVVAQQLGRVRPSVLLAETTVLVGGLVVLRNQNMEQIVTGRELPAIEVLLMKFLVVGAAAVISWRVWVDDRRLLRLATQLRASRLRLVESADAVRRSLERDLHDGAQQRIVAATINLATARRLLGTQPARVDGILDAAIAELHGAATELRDVSHGIYPSELTRDGLEAALRTLATRSPLALTVTTDDLTRRPTDIEAAAYFCCAEAVQNASKHAGVDAHVTIDVAGPGPGLDVTITDDGNGFDPTVVHGGHGLTNMRDRIGAVGGTLTIHAAPAHGTTIHAHIPPRSRRDSVDHDPEDGPIGRDVRWRDRWGVWTGLAVAVATVGVFVAVNVAGRRLVTSVADMRAVSLVALGLVAPLLVTAWRSQQPWRVPLALLMTMYWLTIVTFTVAEPFPRDVWILVLVLAVLTVPGARHQWPLLALSVIAMLLALSVTLTGSVTMTANEWTFPALPHVVAIVLGFVIATAQPIAFGVIAARSIRRHQESIEMVDEVRASRLRLVESADAVRRSLERDLHDGAQQRIVAATINLATARRLLGTQPARVDGILDAAIAELHGAATELRDVSHGIYPSELTRDGLEAALRTLATRSPLALTVTTDDLTRRPTDIEAAAYFCCAEAVQNASKHAGVDAHVTIDVAGPGPGLDVTITDDGNGFDPTVVHGGHGLTNMRDRIGAVGGTLTIHAAPAHGTTIHAHIPPTASATSVGAPRSAVPFVPRRRTRPGTAGLTSP